ncbi:MAG: tRNA (adenosine(37)-N6)-threonylcarbamoyltransferase complex transferase subunit TsaD [Candidatus Cloacimonetes bacterium]|nr:tRNA (adenosine(37)-N6)-threonylcarbamoyltransferase complex transferase subunit TsaD [Candidatus Cloacimonadota bacterium]
MSRYLILGVETSCDDTSVALVDSDYQVLANVTSTQPEHARFGGVVPELASRLHLRNLMPLVRAVYTQSGLTPDDVDAVAVSVNPGLIGSLLVGVSFAKSYAWARELPLVAVNHMAGHVAAIRLEHAAPQPPFLALVVSGGHTQLIRFNTESDYTVVGQTRDDAAGEAFDKTAKLLGLGYPGGPAIDRIAKQGDAKAFAFPRGLNRRGEYDFSYSGLKTSVMKFVQEKGQDFVRANTADIAASVQEAIIDPLVRKTTGYARANGIGRLIMAGGVSANSRLRQAMQEAASKMGAELSFPSTRYCTDNAAMIAAAAVDKVQAGDFAELDLNAFSRKGFRFV